MGRKYSMNGEKKNVFMIPVGKPEGKTPAGILTVKQFSQK
jgi:hypothetical protein